MYFKYSCFSNIAQRIVVDVNSVKILIAFEKSEYKVETANICVSVYVYCH